MQRTTRECEDGFAVYDNRPTGVDRYKQKGIGVTLSEQMSLRLTEPQREYLKREMQRIKEDPVLAGLRISEADVVRALVEQAMLTDTRVGVRPEASE